MAGNDCIVVSTNMEASREKAFCKMMLTIYEGPFCSHKNNRAKKERQLIMIPLMFLKVFLGHYFVQNKQSYFVPCKMKIFRG
jgi:hypothetical protein